MRLNKFMALSGVASRRQCDEIIAEGRVRINARQVRKLGTLIDPDKDLVSVDNKPVRIRGSFVYLMLNKPDGCVTTVKDPSGRQTVMNFLPKLNKRIWPVGRLDFHTSGLLLFTNDGDTAQKMLHPSFEFGKTYVATIKGKLDDEQLQKLRNGVDIGDFVTSKADVELFRSNNEYTDFKITIHEGKNRQVRRMFEAIGSEVLALQRISVGKLHLGDLPIGQSRYLTENEIEYIKSL